MVHSEGESESAVACGEGESEAVVRASTLLRRGSGCALRQQPNPTSSPF